MKDSLVLLFTKLCAFLITIWSLLLLLFNSSISNWLLRQVEFLTPWVTILLFGLLILTVTEKVLYLSFGWRPPFMRYLLHIPGINFIYKFLVQQNQVVKTVNLIEHDSEELNEELDIVVREMNKGGNKMINFFKKLCKNIKANKVTIAGILVETIIYVVMFIGILEIDFIKNLNLPLYIVHPVLLSLYIITLWATGGRGFETYSKYLLVKGKKKLTGLIEDKVAPKLSEIVNLLKSAGLNVDINQKTNVNTFEELTYSALVEVMGSAEAADKYLVEVAQRFAIPVTLLRNELVK